MWSVCSVRFFIMLNLIDKHELDKKKKILFIVFKDILLRIF
jgi:hypothetical protein